MRAAQAVMHLGLRRQGRMLPVEKPAASPMIATAQAHSAVLQKRHSEHPQERGVQSVGRRGINREGSTSMGQQGRT